VRPEKEMGERVAKSLLSRNVIDMIDIDDEYSVIEVVAPQRWVGKSLENIGIACQLWYQRIGYP
jgi:trk system potassium uptake protein